MCKYKYLKLVIKYNVISNSIGKELGIVEIILIYGSQNQSWYLRGDITEKI